MLIAGDPAVRIKFAAGQDEAVQPFMLCNWGSIETKLLLRLMPEGFVIWRADAPGLG